MELSGILMMVGWVAPFGDIADIKTMEILCFCVAIPNLGSSMIDTTVGRHLIVLTERATRPHPLISKRAYARVL